MALKVLTGVLVPDPGSEVAGQARIDFGPHQVMGDATGQNLSEWGDPGNFDNTPSAVVSLKRVTITDRDLFFGATGVVLELFNVAETSLSATAMEVQWNATNGAAINAISYMVIGEA